MGRVVKADSTKKKNCCAQSCRNVHSSGPLPSPLSNPFSPFRSVLTSTVRRATSSRGSPAPASRRVGERGGGTGLPVKGAWGWGAAGPGHDVLFRPSQQAVARTRGRHGAPVQGCVGLWAGAAGPVCPFPTRSPTCAERGVWLVTLTAPAVEHPESEMMAWLVAAATAPVLTVASLSVHVGPPQRPRDTTHAVHAFHQPTHRAVRPPASRGRALFNDPLGSERRQFALIRRINGKIDGADRSSVVRLAAYSFAMPSTAQALLRAHRRGAAVKVVVDSHSARWGSVRNLRDKLGGNRRHRSFVLVCRHSCRGAQGNQHAKFLAISHTGRRHDVVMVGSMNFTRFAAAGQWQDLYSVAGNARLYGEFVRVFKQMTHDRLQPRIDLPEPGDGFRTDVAPLTGKPTVDPVARRLGSVHCRGATGGTGVR